MSHKKGLLFFILLSCTILILILFNQFLSYTPYSTCYHLQDPVHAWVKPIDFSAWILPLTYVPVLVFILVYREMTRMHLLLIAFSVTQVARMASIYMFPFCEPVGAIRLEDGLLNTFFYPNGYCPYDLFYSGHTATLFLLCLFSNGGWRWFFMLLTCSVATMLVLQRVHYTIDILMAFPATWMIYRFSYGLYFFFVKET